ncbi:toll/interleukin-1 receptor domain-containing protein [Aeoliella sp. ICT_H6.2]|uniref:Toll/interleukin-1 receptor domain-containing protein n=1 Tax=Aeoliella straminimaris TaxID=2954799 RepID=A0A9X2JI92_9BACT|nr:toll/interleukin-1 receptor domain-containing protein [Aeoliella straminimaris]MCO6046302.1 toll/interleukin-1 receptor domain-containing protein [Aeoliella straminimaris]
MKSNPYEDAARIESKIVKLQEQVRKKEQLCQETACKLRRADPKGKSFIRLSRSVTDRERDIKRTKQRLNRLFKAKYRVEKEGKRLLNGNRKRELTRRAINRDITRELREQSTLLGSMSKSKLALHERHTSGEQTHFDLFVSHATEDKESLVRPLATALTALSIAVWYDEFTLTIGDSLRKSIDHGLANSRFGLVVLSSDFFAKNWTQYELNGLVSREMEGQKVILPLWHKITKDDVMKFSPTLVDKVALNTSIYSIEEIAEQLAAAIKVAKED